MGQDVYTNLAMSLKLMLGALLLDQCMVNVCNAKTNQVGCNASSGLEIYLEIQLETVSTQYQDRCRRFAKYHCFGTLRQTSVVAQAVAKKDVIPTFRDVENCWGKEERELGTNK